jgi:hypothetical protein
MCFHVLSFLLLHAFALPILPHAVAHASTWTTPHATLCRSHQDVRNRWSAGSFRALVTYDENAAYVGGGQLHIIDCHDGISVDHAGQFGYFAHDLRDKHHYVTHFQVCNPTLHVVRGWCKRADCLLWLLQASSGVPNGWKPGVPGEARPQLCIVTLIFTISEEMAGAAARLCVITFLSPPLLHERIPAPPSPHCVCSAFPPHSLRVNAFIAFAFPPRSLRHRAFACVAFPPLPCVGLRMTLSLPCVALPLPSLHLGASPSVRCLPFAFLHIVCVVRAFVAFAFPAPSLRRACLLTSLG